MPRPTRATAIALAAISLSACGEPTPPTGTLSAATGWTDPADAAPPPRLPEPSTVPLDEFAGQLVLTATHRGESLDPVLAGRLATGRVSGVIISDTTTASVAPTARAVQAAARRGDQPPALVAVDQEGGQVRRLRALPPAASARSLGARPLGLTADLARIAGCRMRAQGITLDLAPVADVPASRRSFIAETDRAFGGDPARVGRYASAFSRGLQRGGVGATVKHFPGLGTATVSSDDSTARAIPAPSSVASFRAALSAGTDAVMMSSATYATGRWATGRPAVLSPQTVGWLRAAGFGGVVVTDDLDAPGVGAGRRRSATPPSMPSALAWTSCSTSTRRGARAEAARQAIVSAVRAAQLPRARVEEAWARVLTLKYRLAVRREAARCPVTSG